MLHSGRDKCEVFIVMYQGGRTGLVGKTPSSPFIILFLFFKNKQNVYVSDVGGACYFCYNGLSGVGFIRGLKMERRSVGKRGEGKESAPARGERDYTGLRGELALYRHTDAPITEQSRVVLLLALKT